MEAGRAASEDTFLTEKSHGSLNLDGNCPSLSAFQLGDTKAGKAVAEKPNTSQCCHAYSATDDCRTDKGASPSSSSSSSLPASSLFSFSHPHPVPVRSPYAAMHAQHSSTHVTFLLVCLVINITTMVSKQGQHWAQTNNTQVSPRGLPLCFPASFASPDHYGRLINKHKMN